MLLEKSLPVIFDLVVPVVFSIINGMFIFVVLTFKESLKNKIVRELKENTTEFTTVSDFDDFKKEIEFKLGLQKEAFKELNTLTKENSGSTKSDLQRVYKLVSNLNDKLFNVVSQKR